MDGDYNDCIAYLTKSNLLGEYKILEEFIRSLNKTGLEVADLAAGIGWAAILLSKLESIATVHAVEISKHRIGALFEQCIKMFDGNPDKLKRYLGSFYNTKFESQKMDIVLLNQAFHHADDPINLLKECSRILKPDGYILISGEHLITKKIWLRRIVSFAIRCKKISINFKKLFPTNLSTGDHYYRTKDYYSMFYACGMRAKFLKLPSGNAIYIVRKILLKD